MAVVGFIFPYSPLYLFSETLPRIQISLKAFEGNVPALANR